jgi:hypothetical protein
MRAFLRPSRGDVDEPASSGEQPGESIARSSVEQPAENIARSTSEQSAATFTSIEAVNRWLKAQGEASSSPELRRLSAAVVVLARKPKPRQEDVFPLCSSWNVRAKEKRKIGHFRR